MKLTERRLRKMIVEEIQKLSEQEKWSQDVDVDEGGMHDALGIPQDEDINDHYTSGEQLARDLIDAVGREEAAGMINFAANVNPDYNLYDRAQNALNRIEEE